MANGSFWGSGLPYSDRPGGGARGGAQALPGRDRAKGQHFGDVKRSNSGPGEARANRAGPATTKGEAVEGIEWVGGKV